MTRTLLVTPSEMNTYLRALCVISYLFTAYQVIRSFAMCQPPCIGSVRRHTSVSLQTLHESTQSRGSVRYRDARQIIPAACVLNTGLITMHRLTRDPFKAYFICLSIKYAKAGICPRPYIFAVPSNSFVV